MDGTKRPRRQRRREVERVKSVLIVLLSLSALYLTLLTLSFSKVSWVPFSGLLGLLPAGEPGTSDSTLSGAAAGAPVPVRVAVCDGRERYITQYDSLQTTQLYDQVGILLTEALAGAQSPVQVSESAWRQALQSPSAWFDFLGAFPLEVLYAWMGEGSVNPALIHTARQLTVALTESGTVWLYYQNTEDGLFYGCPTSVAYSGHMETLLSGRGSGGGLFVFEQPEDSGYEGLDPYVVISSQALSMPVYRASNPLSGIGEELVAQLQQALYFQAQSNSVYPVANGVRIREGRETLEITSDGVVSYHTVQGEADRYPTGGGELTALAELTRRLAADTVGRWCGEAQLCLLEISQEEDGSVILRYGYQLDGAEVVLSSGLDAACFTVQGGQIVDYTLCFRSYESTGESALVLRERQAAAALSALDAPGNRLLLCYGDTGGDRVQAGWTAE